MIIDKIKLKLDLAMYKGKTRLRQWYPIVLGHMKEIETTQNNLADKVIEDNKKLVQAISDEAAERDRVDGLLFDNITDAAAAITAETAAREMADGELSNKIAAEAAARQSADNELRGNLVDIAAALTAETAAREAADNALDERVKPLEDASHTHDNKEILDAITGERVQKWDSIKDQVTQEQLDAFFEHLYEIAIGHDLELEKVYAAIGLTVYDGGLIGAPISGTLDCGEIDDEITGIIDCGGPEPYIAEIAADSSTIDGGTLDTPSDGSKIIDGGELQ